MLDFTSEYTTGNGSASQAAGLPNTFAYGDIPTAWTTSSTNINGSPADGTPEYITLGFATPLYADGVTVRETYGNGFVYRIDVRDAAGVLHVVWQGTDPSPRNIPVDFRVEWPLTPYLVTAVRVFVNTDSTTSWEEIDAVALHGQTTAPNATPVATPQTVTVTKNVPKAITLTGTDADGNPLTFAIVTPPTNGALSGTPPNVTYTPQLDFVGSDSFTFKVNDGTEDSAPATVNISVTTPFPPDARNALVLDGVDDYVSLPNGLIQTATTFTLEAWFRTSQSGIIFGYQSQPYSLIPAQYVPILYVGTDGRLYGGLWDGLPAQVSTAGVVNDNRWRHAALTLVSNTIALYLDGSAVGTTTSSGIAHLDMTVNQIGIGYGADWPAAGAGWFPFAGQMDDVRLWYVARTQADVQGWMNTELVGNEPGLVGYWNFDDDTANDRQTNVAKSNGTLQNGASLVVQSDVVPAPAVLALRTGFDDLALLTISDGVPDENWVIVGPPEVPIHSQLGIATSHPAWAPNTSTSRWLGLPGYDSIGPPGAYVFRTKVSIPTGSNASQARIVGFLSADNTVDDILINGVSTGATTAGFTVLAPLPANLGLGLFQSGENTVEILVSNTTTTPSPVGLRVDAVVTTFTPSANNVLVLDGVDDAVDVGNPASLRITGALTLEAWFRTSALVGNYRMLVSKWFSGGENASYSLHWDASGLRFILGNTSLQQTGPGSGQLLNDGRWHHVAGTWDGTTASIYIDGVLVSSVQAPGFGPLADTALPVKIGTDARYPPGTGDRFFNGQMDEVRIWSVARAAPDIVRDMRRTLAGNEAGLAGYWRFDDGSANDLTTNANHGTFQNGATLEAIGTPSLSATALDFGVVDRGATRTFDVTNIGSAPLSVTDILSSNAAFGVAPRTFALAPSQTQVVTVTFPTRVGWETSTLTVVHDGTMGPDTVSVSGIGRITPPTGNLAHTKIAFRSTRDGNDEVYIANSDGTGPVRLTTDPAPDYLPVWSPDGTRIAFTSYRDGNAEVWVMNADGSGLTQLTNVLQNNSVHSWSPDGTKIAFFSDRTGDGSVWVMNADGTGPAHFTATPVGVHDGNPAWSPDGTKIAFDSLRDGTRFEIYAMDGTDADLDGNGDSLIRLTNNAYDDFQPIWSPDGTRIAFVSNRPDAEATADYEIYVMNADGTNPVRLTNNAADDVHPSWSPDGTKIVFASNRSDAELTTDYEIYAMDAADTDLDGNGDLLVRLTNNSSLDDFVRWSPFLPAPIVVSPTPDQVFPVGTTSVQLQVNIGGHTGPWAWRFQTPFPTSGPAKGNIVATGNTATIAGLTDGQNYTIHVALLDQTNNVLFASFPASVAFSVAFPQTALLPYLDNFETETRWGIFEEIVGGNTVYETSIGEVSRSADAAYDGVSSLRVWANKAQQFQSNHVIAQKRLAASGQTGTWLYRMKAYIAPETVTTGEAGPEFSIQNGRTVQGVIRTAVAGIQCRPQTGAWAAWNNGAWQVFLTQPLAGGQWYDLELEADYSVNRYVRFSLSGGGLRLSVDLSAYGIAEEDKGWNQEAFWLTLEAENQWTNGTQAVAYKVYYDSVAALPAFPLASLVLADATGTRTASVGISGLAAEGADLLDIPAPAEPQGSAIALTLVRTVSLLRDVLPTPTGGAPLSWTLHALVTGGTSSTATLGWNQAEVDQLLLAAGNYDVALLRDTTTGQSVSMTATNNPLTLNWQSTGSYNFEIRFTKTVYQTVNVSLADGWNMLSVPGAGSLSPLAAASMATYRWDATTQAYAAVMSAAFIQTTLLPVRTGFFLRPTSGAAGSVALSLDLASTATMANVSLAPNWNLIGAPASAAGVPANLDADGAGPMTAIDGGLPPTVLWYNPATRRYEVAASLVQGRGYWVLNVLTTARTVDLSQPPGDIPASSAREPIVAVPQPDWVFRLALELPDGFSQQVELGAGRDAVVSFDRYDIPLPPHPDPEALELYAEVDHLARRLTRSVQPIGREGAEWTLVSVAPDDAAVRWDGLSLAQGYRAVLEWAGRTYDLSQRGSLHLPKGAHRLRVRIAWTPPQTTRLLPNHPNPFNPETWIPFELKEPAAVRVSIWDTRGSLVRSLDLGYLPAGYYTTRNEAAHWDGRNEHGEHVASGVYFYQLQAGTLHDMRRMVLLK